ncbi:MAG TPA: site-specific DNA-methyltransferase, partial [Acidimicrobiales bacterium]|nr:site-specific DNA-methyltransferase [Acidimicrobiales bacterium]
MTGGHVVPRNQVLVGDARMLLQTLPNQSVDCVVTSPPYFMLRDYGVAGQMGLEDTVSDWVSQLRLVMQGIARVLKPTGTLWLNLGDTYSRHLRYGAPPKSLLLGPERLALGPIEDGWVLRNKLIFAKTNPMPSSVGDRLSCTWEVVYVLARSRSYFFDL